LPVGDSLSMIRENRRLRGRRPRYSFGGDHGTLSPSESEACHRLEQTGGAKWY
jgi:hypothetical protein